jgi:hypothetical protein
LALPCRARDFGVAQKRLFRDARRLARGFPLSNLAIGWPGWISPKESKVLETAERDL